MSDSLSRDIDLSDENLVKLLTLYVPSQIPPNFRIVPLKSEIVSWLCSLMDKLPVCKARQTRHTKRELGAGKGGSSSSNKLGSVTNPFSNISANQGAVHSSSPPLYKPCDNPASLHSISLPWLKERSAQPLIMWHRPSGLVTALTPEMTTVGVYPTLYSSNIKATRINKRMSSNRKTSLSSSSDNSTRTKPQSKTYQFPNCVLAQYLSPCDHVNTFPLISLE